MNLHILVFTMFFFYLNGVCNTYMNGHGYKLNVQQHYDYCIMLWNRCNSHFLLQIYTLHRWCVCVCVLSYMMARSKNETFLCSFTHLYFIMSIFFIANPTFEPQTEWCVFFSSRKQANEEIKRNNFFLCKNAAFIL